MAPFVALKSRVLSAPGTSRRKYDLARACAVPARDHWKLLFTPFFVDTVPQFLKFSGTKHSMRCQHHRHCLFSCLHRMRSALSTCDKERNHSCQSLQDRDYCQGSPTKKRESKRTAPDHSTISVP